MGDPHGGNRAIVQVLERANFNYEEDRLIVVGDVCDGWSETPQCFEELFRIKNLIYIMGNHDEWALKWMTGEFSTNPDQTSFTLESQSWLMHGGKATKEAYLANYDLVKTHRDFLQTKALPYFLDEENRLFVHAGFDHEFPIDEQSPQMLCWDRELWKGMFEGRNWCKEYKEVYLGHTPTLNFNVANRKIPITRKNCVNIDTGAAFTGPLTVMEVGFDHNYFQSDDVRTLYPDEVGRNGRTYEAVKKYGE